jgi:predicted permease
MRGRAARRVYRALLLLFPRPFREERGRELERVFDDMCAEWETREGGLGPAFWARTAWDTAGAAAGEWTSLAAGAARSVTTQRVGEEMSIFVGDVLYALRQFVRQPLYAATIVLLMMVGIAGNAAVFRIYNGLFLRPLPFESAERLVDMDETAPRWDLEWVGIAYPDFIEWRRSNRTFEGMAVYTTGGANFAAAGAAERVDLVQATHDLDDVLGMAPSLGRFFTEAEDQPDGPRVALLSNGFWTETFARSPDAIGRMLTLDGEPHEIVGVLPPAARFVDEADLWVPLREAADGDSGWYLNGIGRLGAGVTIEQAAADLLAVHQGMLPGREVNSITSPVLHSLRDRYLGDVRLGSGFLLAAVGIVLLIACANIAGLMFARSMARESEIAVRRALGAQRMRIVRQLLTESTLLALVGGGLGATLGIWGSGALTGTIAERFPPWVTFDLDLRFLAFTLAVTSAAAVLFGLTPALQASRREGGLPSSSRATASASRRRGMSLLVTTEVALALVLLVVGGLSALDVWRLGRVDPGFRVDDIAAYRLQLPEARYPDRDAGLAFIDEHLRRLRSLPEVESATVASALPLSGHWGWFFEAENAPPRGEGEADPVVLTRFVTPGYFETMDVALLAGRTFDEFDGREEGSMVVIVDEAFVRSHLAHAADPVGARIRTGSDDPWYTVIGLARDVRHYGLDEDPRPGVYQPMRQSPWVRSMQIAVRASGGAAAALASARASTAEQDSEVPLHNVSSMTEILDRSLWTRRATSWLIATFSGAALLLATAGLYGVISYSVGERTREISIRMAVGARHAQVGRQVVRDGMTLVGVGVVLGLVLSLAAARLVSGILVGVSATDPAVYAAVTGLLLVVAGLANYFPARRAASLDPIRALRSE